MGQFTKRFWISLKSIEESCAPLWACKRHTCDYITTISIRKTNANC